MIETDGVSCSILMLRNDMIGKRISNVKISFNTEQYIYRLHIDSNKMIPNKIVYEKDLYRSIPEGHGCT